MKYMLLVYTKEDDYAPGEREECMAHSAELCQELQDKGQLISAGPLRSITTATSVRVREGKRVITDGPFAETYEQLGGYFMIDVPDLDRAMDIAARIPGAQKGAVEIRPLERVPALEAMR